MKYENNKKKFQTQLNIRKIKVKILPQNLMSRVGKDIKSQWK